MLNRKSVIKLGLLMSSGIVASTVPVIVAMADESTDDVEDNPIANDSSERILTIHKYLSDSSDGPIGDGTSSYNPTNKTSLSGIKFQIDKVSFIDGVKPDASDSSTYKVDKSNVDTITTDSSGIATEDFGKGTANDGVYLVTEQDNADVKTKAAPFFVQMPMTYRDNDQNKLQYHVTVYPKNSVDDGMNFLSTVNIHGSNSDEAADQAGGQANVNANDDTNFQDPTSSGQKDVWNLTSMIPGLSVNGSKASGDLGNSQGFTEYAEVNNISNNSPLNFIKTDNFGLSYVDDNGKVQFDKDLSDQFTEGTDYTVSYVDPDSNDSIQKQLQLNVANSASKILKIDFTAAGRQKILQLAQTQADDAKPTDPDYHKKLLFTTNLTTQTPAYNNIDQYVYYELTSGLVYTDSTGVQDTLPANYSNDVLNSFGIKDFNTSPVDPTTEGETIEIQKYDQTRPKIDPNINSILPLNNVLADDDDDSDSSDSSEPKYLPGAEFKIADTEANAKAGKYIKVDGQGKIYYPGQEGYGDSGQTDYARTSDDDGEVIFGMLRSDEDSDDPSSFPYEEYWAVETKAPAGYELDKNPIPIGTQDDDGFEYVGDEPQTAFPLTGGHILLLVAFVVIASGTGYYIYQKSKKNKVEK